MTVSLVTDMPRVIWTLWLQGWEDAPEVAQSSLASWRRMNPGWTVQALTRDNLTEHLPGETVDLIFAAPRPPEVYANLVRLELLTRHGGVWADGTTIAARPLDDWLVCAMSSGFFAFAAPGPDRMISTWFLASVRASPVTRLWLAACWSYWQGREERHTYHWMHGLFGMLYDLDPEFRLLWDATPKISAQHPLHFGPGAPPLLASPTPDMLSLLADPPAPVYKLTFKGTEGAAPDSLLFHLCAMARGR